MPRHRKNPVNLTPEVRLLLKIEDGMVQILGACSPNGAEVDLRVCVFDADSLNFSNGAEDYDWGEDNFPAPKHFGREQLTDFKGWDCLLGEVRDTIKEVMNDEQA